MEKLKFVDIPWDGLAFASLFVLVTLLYSILLDLRKTKELIVGSIRCFVQLLTVGYILKTLFGASQFWSLAAVGVMLSVATLTAFGRLKEKQDVPLRSIILISITVGAVPAVVFALAAVVRAPILKQQYIVPIGSMVIGNAMNVTAIALDRFLNDIRQQRLRVEAALALGATARQATRPLIAAAIKAAIIPSINYLFAVGLVHLPGMMTGQMLGGVSPLQAVKYQVLIMYMLLCANTTAAVVATLLARRRLLKHHRLAL